MEHFLENLVTYIYVLFVNHGESIGGFILAFYLGILRTKQKYGKADWLEGAICGGLTLSMSSILEWLSLPQSFAIAVGGFIGFMGTNFIRQEAYKKFSKNQKD